MSSLPTLYKARRVPLKQPVCAICIDRTRGRTTQVGLGYGVTVWLCAGHAGAEFLTGRGGRDLVLTLMRTWQAHGCLTANRHKALTAHLNALRTRPRRPRPGSYAWPQLRLKVEALATAGASAAAVHRLVDHGRYGVAAPPSRRTLRRWLRERRWVAEARAGPFPTPPKRL